MGEHLVVGRYLLHRKIARGGMATIHIARLLGDVGFSRIVAAKRMHPELAEDDEFVAMFLDEARIASRVQHRSVVNVLDVVTLGDEVMLVQEYVHGAPLSTLLRVAYEQKAHVPVPVAAAIACQVLAGLHAAHETVDELGTPLEIVHRDVSPQNVLVALDGTARLLDFGVAKAALSAHVTRKGTFKGKLGYSSPEQIRGEARRQSDIYSLGVVLWELVVGHRLRATQSDAQLIAEILAGKTPTITEALAGDRAFCGAYRWSQLEALEPVIRKSLDVHARRRWQTAAEMEDAITAAVPIAPPSDVAAWLRAVGRDFLDERERLIAEEEVSWRRNAHLFSARSSSEGEHTPPPGHATESGASSRSVLRSITTAIIATLVVAVGATFAFVARDLESSTPSPATMQPAPLPPAAVPHTTKPPPQIEAPREAEPPNEGALSHEETLPHDEPAPPRAITRTRPVRPAPPRPPPARTTVPSPPRPGAATLDCSTPFYFEGRKKIFKTGCL